MKTITRRIPLMMMRTRSLLGPFFGIHKGKRQSKPIAKSTGNAYSAGKK